ncbi:hypothetical protein BJX70DRAFT_407212 [Aspergillus crustosus]
MASELKGESAPTSVTEIWEKTIARFQQRTGQRLDGVSRGSDDLQRLLDAHYAMQADGEAASKAKTAGFQMIYCIQLLGGLVSEGASMVFAPAGLCFNALSFLLDIPKKVHEFHDEIHAIFAEVGPALAQFRIYERMEETSQIDEALRMSIYQVMTSLVNLCADCINIHHEGRWKSFKRNAKRVLLDDGSVKDELDNFKTLTQNQLNIQATLTLEVAVETGQHVRLLRTTTVEIDANTKAIKSDVSGLVEAEHKRSVDDNRKQNLTTIKTKLDQKGEKIAAALEARDNMWKGCIPDSGKWLDEVDAYKQWISRNGASGSLLALIGDVGTGKSFLVSTIFQEIRSDSLATKAGRGLIGYHSFSMVEKGDRDSERHRPEDAIKSICVQLAEQDFVYSRRVSGVCNELGKDERYFRDASCKELWATLEIGAPTKNTTHYILLDSISALNAEERERLAEAIEQTGQGKSDHVRVLVTGEPSAFQDGRLSSSSVQSIEITQFNEVDIKAFIVEELKRATVFQGADEDSQRRQKMVEERLIKRSGNSYSTVQHDLRKVREIIASGGTEEELNRALQESSTDPDALVRSDLETLEAVRKPREIEEINELLIWTVAGHGYFDLDELAAALFLCFNTVSLLPLGEKINGKYSKLFTLTDGGRYLVLKDHPRQSEDDPKITATINITNGDFKLVQRFFWDLNHHTFQGGFAFDPASGTPNSGKGKIQVYEADAHLAIVKRAFDFFLQPSVDKRGQALGRYLMGFLPIHLKALSELTGLEELQPADKQFIGSHVYEMFNDGDLIERNWEFCDWVSWYSNHDDLDIFWEWLDDPVAVARLGRRDKRWLAEVKKDEHRNSSLLTPIMTMVARHWLQETSWSVSTAFTWIRGFLALDNETSGGEEAEEAEEAEESNKDDDGRVIIYPDDDTPESIAKSEQWCRQVLRVSEGDASDNDVATEQYKKAASLLQAQDPVNKEQLRDVLKALSEWSTDSESALKYLQEASQQDEGNVEILYSLVQRYVDSKNEDQARFIIQRAIDEKVPETESTLLTAMLKSAAANGDDADALSFFKATYSLMSSSPEWLIIFQHEMQAAITAVRAEDKHYELAILLLQLGMAEYHQYIDSPKELEGAVSHLHECLETIKDKATPEDRNRLDITKEDALVQLSMFHLEKAMQSDAEESEHNLDKLRKIHEDDPDVAGPRAVLASLYTFKGQRDKARDLYRAGLAEAFHILADDDLDNDGSGFSPLRKLLLHAGDYENALRAMLQLPSWDFDGNILQAFLAVTEPFLEEATAELVQFYETECSNETGAWNSFQKIWKEAKRLASEAEVGSERATWYQNVNEKLEQISLAVDSQFSCNNCDRPWDFNTGLHTCKYCYDMDLCDDCWNELRSGGIGKTLVCRSTHDWFEIPPWTMQNYISASGRMVSMNIDDGDEELVHVSKWLGTLCEEWGLSKADWGFE